MLLTLPEIETRDIQSENASVAAVHVDEATLGVKAKVPCTLPCIHMFTRLVIIRHVQQAPDHHALYTGATEVQRVKKKENSTVRDERRAVLLAASD